MHYHCERAVVGPCRTKDFRGISCTMSHVRKMKIFKEQLLLNDVDGASMFNMQYASFMQCAQSTKDWKETSFI